MTHSHTHSDVVVTSGATTHNHAPYAPPTGYTNCGVACTTKTHRHAITMGQGNSHNHSVTVSFAAAELGSPNWWEHQHLATAVIANGGGAHNNHSIQDLTDGGRCGENGCDRAAYNHDHATWDELHVPPPPPPSLGNGGAVHNHTASGYTTDADPSGTPQNHTHLFSIGSSSNDSHTHTIYNMSIQNSLCFLECNHTHTTPSATDAKTHFHGVGGTSGSGGEPPPAVPITVIGDGLVWIAA